MSEISISVIVPIYRSEEFLADCIESVLHQTLSNLELILVDDGSDDNSGCICDDYAKRDKRIRVIHQPNRGRSEARARGVLEASGEWISFVDSDDRLPQDALDSLFHAVDNNTDIVLGNGYSLGLHPCPKKMEMEEFRHLAVRGEGTIGVPWGSLYRRGLLTVTKPTEEGGTSGLPWVFDIPRSIINGEDYLFWLRLVFLTENPVSIVEKSVYEKGDEHTCHTFVWTASYCHELNELRRLSIPASQRDDYFEDILADRLVNLFSVAVCTKRSDWACSAYYQDILSDLQRQKRQLPLKQRLFLLLPSRWLRRTYSSLSQLLSSLRK